MAKDEIAGLDQKGANITKLKKDIVAGVKRIQSLKLERQAVNEAMGEVRASLEAKGIPKKALNMAMNYLDMDPDQREGFDIAYDIVREAIELPVQHPDLFDEGRKNPS